MARETKIGVALMVLLVGVFGFIVYKKWNGRQPTVVAAASEAADAKAKAGDAAAEPTTAEPPTTAGTAAAPAEVNPFAASGTSPPAQAEPGGAVADASRAGTSIPVRQVSAVTERSPFAPGTPAAEADPFGGSGPAAQSEPAAQGEPVAQSEPAAQAEPAAPAAEGEFVPIRRSAAASAEPFSRSTATAAETTADAKTASPAVEEDPFGGAATTESTAAATTEKPEASGPAAATADDPFGQASTAAAASPMPSDDAFGGAAVETAKADAAASAEPASKPQPEADPFSGAAETPKATEATAAAPETSTAAAEASRMASGADDPFGAASPGKAEPAADTASATPEQPVAVAPQENAFEPAVSSQETFEPAGAPGRLGEPVAESASEPAAAKPSVKPSAEPSAGPFEQPAPAAERTERTGFCLVEENDSYWAISKRVYGTPAYFHALAKYNETRIGDPKRLRPGMKVLTPPPDELARRYPSLVSAGGSGGKPQDAGEPGLFTDESGRPAYRVGPEDTLGKIAQAHLGRASRWVQIYEMNRDVVPNAKVLKPGTVLKLPSDASRVRLVPER